MARCIGAVRWDEGVTMIRRSRQDCSGGVRSWNVAATRFFRSAAASLFAVMAVAACQTTEPAKWVKVTPAESKLVYGGPDLRASTTAVKRSVSKESHVRWWIGTGGLPRLGVSYSGLYPNYLYAEDADLSKLLSHWKFLKEEDLEFVGTDRIQAAAGQFDILDFRFDRNECFGFMHKWGSSAGADNDHFVPTNHLHGYYCDRKRLSKWDMQSVLNHIGVRGYNAPARIAPTATAASSAAPDISCRSRIGVVSTMKEHLCLKFGGEVIP